MFHSFVMIFAEAAWHLRFFFEESVFPVFSINLSFADSEYQFISSNERVYHHLPL